MFTLSKELSKSFKQKRTFEHQVSNNTDIKAANICIINDSPIIQEGIVSFISDTPNVNQIITTSKADYFDKHATKQIDIVITEIEFGNKIEASFVEQIKAISPETRIIVYTRIENHDIRNKLLRNGADAFIFLRDISYLLEHIVKIMIRSKHSYQ